MNASLAVQQSLFQIAIAVASRLMERRGHIRPTAEDREVNAHLLSHPEIDVQDWLEDQCQPNPHPGRPPGHL